MSFVRRAVRLKISTALCLSLLPMAVCAQQPAAFEEIVVTANKRQEEASKVPISIAAYNEEGLEASGVKSFGDLAALTPGVEFDTSSGFGPGTMTNIAIRGINSSVGTSTTGIYIDDTPIQSRVTALSYFGNPLPLMFDVGRVEVERGPQGTLFGAGAEGGALRFISAEPDLTRYSGMARGEAAFTDGGGPSYEAGAAVGGPIVDNKLAFRVSAWNREDGGYVDRVDPLTGATAETNANSSRSWVMRGALTVAPTDWLTITPSFYQQAVHNHDSSAWFEYLSDPSAGNFVNGRLLRQPSADGFFLPSLRIEADAGGAELTSVTSYVNRSGHLLDDLTSYSGSSLGVGIPYGDPRGVAYPTSASQAAPGYLTTTLHQLSQELRASSAESPAPLKWTAGIFYSHTTQTDGEDVYSPFYMTNLFGLPAGAPMLSSSLLSDDTQLALFGQADYRILDGLTVTVGARTARTLSQFAQEQGGPLSGGGPASGSEKETPFTPKIGLSYQIDAADMVYGTISKGFRVGGANPPIPLLSASDPAGCPLPSQPGPYSSDKVWSYEIGTKDRFLDDKLKIDASAFHIDWSNIQQQVFLASCGFGYVANTGSATSNGFDLSAEALVGESLMLGASVAYTDAKVANTVSANGSVIEQSGDVIGSPPNVGAPWSVTLSATYNFTLFGKDAYARAEDIYHSHNDGPFNTMIASSALYAPDIHANPDTNQLDVRVGIDWSGVDLSVFVNNLLNAHPALGRYQDTTASTLFTDTTFRPLTAGVTASYHF